MNDILKARIRLCGKRHIDVVNELRKKGMDISCPKFCEAINGYRTGPKPQLILAEAVKIVTAWEKEQGRVWNDKAIGF